MSIRTFKFRQGRSRPNRLNTRVFRACELVLGSASCANSSNAAIEGGQVVPSRTPIRCFGHQRFIGRVRSDRLRPHSQRHPESKESFC
jgi:hypothetical protein